MSYVYMVLSPPGDTVIDPETILMKNAPTITIHYCSQCNWLLQAGWMAQELLHTFSTDLAAVTLVPGTGGAIKSPLMAS